MSTIMASIYDGIESNSSAFISYIYRFMDVLEKMKHFKYIPGMLEKAYNECVVKYL